jgi:hypothetical protein
MNGNAIWEQEAADKAELILEGGYARLSDYGTGGTTSARRSG